MAAIQKRTEDDQIRLRGRGVTGLTQPRYSQSGIQICRGQESWLPAKLRSLFEGIGKYDQGRLLPGLANKRQPHWQAKVIRGRNCNMGVSCDRGRGGTLQIPVDRIPVDEVDQPGGST